jgi:mannose-6-phosphate isomerase-like protein (cupin superfamily)
VSEAEGGFVLGPGDGRRIDVGSFNVNVKAAREQTGGAFTLIETEEAVLGAGPPLHIHRDAAESFYVLAGEYLMHLDGRDYECPAGSFVYVPRGLPHTFKVTIPGSRKLNLYTPAAMEGYFDELANAIRGRVDEDGLTEIAERYDMEILGPPPEGYF